MSKQCKIVEDLLPLYHDGVCSKESRQMVDEHLAQCGNCRKMLGRIDDELVSPAAKDADIAPLKNITKTVNKGKRKSLFTGISITLAFVLVLLSGAGIWWYTHEYSYYLPFTEDRKPNSIYEYYDDGNIKQSIVTDAGKYTWYDDTYRYDVEVPSFLSNNGYVRMTRLDNTENKQVSVLLSRWKGTSYVFHVSFFGDNYNWLDENSGVNWPYFIVDSEMNQYYPDHWTEKSVEEHNAKLVEYKAKLVEYKDEVQNLIDDAMAMWPFIQ